MNRKIFFRLVFISTLLHFQYAKSQRDHFAYAVTSISKGSHEWIALRKLDTRTGEFSNILLNVRDNQYQIADSSVAAIAYDRKSNRLFYVPMNIDQLRYIDLSTMGSVAVPDQFFSTAGKYDARNSGPINRMVIAPDGYGYTITNDGTHLIRFGTSGTPILSDLGDLVDDPMNKEMTIHSICTNSGGDLIADDAGHLYLITGYNKVYQVDIATRKTTYLATLTGLPQKFTTSGAAVSEDGRQLLISSSVYADSYFIINPETWNASSAASTHELYETSDLANSNVLFTSSAKSPVFISKFPENLNKITIYPNPVLDDNVSIQFHEMPPGNYTVQLANETGKNLLQQKLRITGEGQSETLHIPHHTSQGFYYIQILDEKNNIVDTQKLIVERW